MSNVATYSVLNDTKNSRVDLPSLRVELGQAGLPVNLEKAGVDGETLTLEFSGSVHPSIEPTILAVLGAHEGNPAPETSVPQVVTFETITNQGLPKVAATKPDGSSFTAISHNFCDNTTWELGSANSQWIFPHLGANTKVYKAEVQFTTDVIDSFNTDASKVLVLDVMAGGFPVPSEQKVFNTIFDVYDLGNMHYHTPGEGATTIGGGITTVQFDYTDAIILDASLGMAMCFHMQGNLEMPGTHCSVSLVVGPA